MNKFYKLTTILYLITGGGFCPVSNAYPVFINQNNWVDYSFPENNYLAEQNCNQVYQKYNHYAYEEVSRDLLVSVGNSQFLHPDAARAFIEMRQAARRDGIILTPISGFRSVSQQNYLFYGVAKREKQTLEQRATVSAPPGHSQHHTGFALDINSLNPSFANTKAFAWLEQNAKTYGFELSFPRNNAQGVAFEPWHWAWHGSEEARQALHDGCVQTAH